MKFSGREAYQQSATVIPVFALSMPLTPVLFKVKFPHLSFDWEPVRVACKVKVVVVAAVINKL